MKISFLLFFAAAILFWSCSMIKKEPLKDQNPFLLEYNTPFNVPPFDKIKEEHYLPAFKEGMKQEWSQIKAIANSSEAPTFKNTIETIEASGVLLTKVSNVFDNLKESNTNDQMQEIAREVSPLLSEHNDNILLNEELFLRVKVVHENRDKLDLTVEQRTLLEKTYRDFVRGGANLDAEKKAELREINKELSLLSLKFGENVLEENNRFELVIEDEADLAGLTEASITGATEAAEERGHEGKWVFTIHKPSWTPFLQYSEKRELREQMFKGYINKGDNGDNLDNNKTLARMVALRVKRANLLGYPTYADFVLEENMAKEPDKVYQLLDRLWTPALARARQEAAEFQEMIRREGHDFKLEPWDWWYYAEKVKKANYNLDDAELRPYFQLENVQSGAFDVAYKLFGITLEERTDIPVYHEGVKVFEVKEADGSHIGLLYTDYHLRASKGAGAWMSSFRKQSRRAGVDVTPIIINVFNFPKPTGGKPALLSQENVETLFHEFGHALQGLLSSCTYRRLSGTSVPRDYVELCSQIMENWATEPEVLKEYARHYLTGEPIPDDLIARIKKARHFNQGFDTVESLAASYLDMDWHTLTDAEERTPDEFESASLGRIGLIPEIVTRYRSTYFKHIFVWGYSAGYYSYIWAEVLDADAFQAFKEAGLFDRETALAFRKNILETGGTEDPMTLYKRFRGAEPKIDALLKRRGLD